MPVSNQTEKFSKQSGSYQSAKIMLLGMLAALAAAANSQKLLKTV